MSKSTQGVFMLANFILLQGKVAEDENKENTIEQTNISLNSEYVASNSTASDKPVVSKYMPPIPANQGVCCKCACANNKRQGMDTPPGTGRNNFTVKKKTCFHCGTSGQIALNCPNRAYVPYYAQGWQNVQGGRFYKRNHSRSCSDNGDWNAQKA
ncbi:uncharacterized protein LOC128126684 [Lactuca sativa]|uniref:uncharacterized protein LOC128126684 n=1 Tax=Lactuca sativa TaxID=4236 RepID=UPI0022B0709E|nr:uncharacterized protein LOC128126684 [Lactuca sativa]